MKTIYADFNDFASDGTLPLTCAGSLESVANQTEGLQEGEEVMLSDGELRVKARLSRRSDGAWEAHSQWNFEK
jgi:hypothetical protein